jgi:uncharacterized membrane protein YdjX (TVP38/TMEM64 family)
VVKNSLNKQKPPKKKRIIAYCYIGFIIIILTLTLIFLFRRFPNLWAIFADQQKIRAFISGYGVRAPMILVGLQVLQIIFAPIPGHLIAFTSGYLFGAINGTLLSILGIAIGGTIAFWIARFFGRRVLLTFISSDKMHKFDDYILHKGPFIIFILLLIPFSPLGDVIYYLSGLTPLPFLVFFIMVIIARLPGNIVSNLIGAKAFTFTGRDWLIFLGIIIVFALVFYFYRKHIEKIILRFVELSE